MRKGIDVTVADNIKLWEQVSQFTTESCGEDCLHAGFRETTDLVASEIGIDKSKYVLDVCSGLGGSAMYLASKYGCKVVGIDITEKSVEYAKKKAEEKGVDSLVEFHLGNALDMPFPANHFDAAFSEDAPCHVTDKGKVIDETARVLKPGGLFCFTDYVWPDGVEVTDEMLNEICVPWCWPYLETADGYIEYFKQQGLRLVAAKDRTDFLKRHSREQRSSLPSKKEHIVKTYGQEAYDKSVRGQETFLKHVEMGNLQYWLFTARKPF